LTIGAVREVLMTFQMKKIEEMAKIAAQPDTRERLRNVGFEASVGSTDSFNALVQKELRKWAQVVKETGAKVE
jgi:tripartite-type tricarboxylate transporter receptor subunit TctC